MKKGFYTALGTPFDKEGNFLAESMTRHIETADRCGSVRSSCDGFYGK